MKILVAYGTRPEAIKMAPVVEALRRRAERCNVRVCTTAQHREMVDQVESVLGLAPDIDLDLMRPRQRLNELAARALGALDGVLASEQPDWLLVQGDTTTAMAGALAAFHQGIRVGHVEAGLRTGDLARPFPEEANRRIIDVVAAAAFAPTTRARNVLLAEGLPAERVHVTGNTVVDALMAIRKRIAAVDVKDEVLITVHRRESFGAPLRSILEAMAALAASFPRWRWVYPVHPNPAVRGPAHEMLGHYQNVELHEPFDYLELVRRLMRCRLVLTDSGGLQEEAPTLGKPVLVLREITERPEGVTAGVARLVGTDKESIVAEVTRLLTDAAAYREMARAVSPYGDGRSGERIAAVLSGEPVGAMAEPAALRGELTGVERCRD